MRACAVLALVLLVPAPAAAEPPDHLDLATEGSRTLGMLVSPGDGVGGVELSSARTWSALGIRTGGLYELYDDPAGRRVHAGGWIGALRVSAVPFVTLDTSRTAACWRWLDVYAEVGGLLGLARVAGQRRFRADLWVGPGIDLRLGLRRLRRLPVLSVRYLYRAGRWPRGGPGHTIVISIGMGRAREVRAPL